MKERTKSRSSEVEPDPMAPVRDLGGQRSRLDVVIYPVGFVWLLTPNKGQGRRAGIGRRACFNLSVWNLTYAATWKRRGWKKLRKLWNKSIFTCQKAILLSLVVTFLTQECDCCLRMSFQTLRFSFFSHFIWAGLWPGGQTRSALRFGAHSRDEIFRRGPGLTSALSLRRWTW